MGFVWVLPHSWLSQHSNFSQVLINSAAEQGRLKSPSTLLYPVSRTRQLKALDCAREVASDRAGCWLPMPACKHAPRTFTESDMQCWKIDLKPSFDCDSGVSECDSPCLSWTPALHSLSHACPTPALASLSQALAWHFPFPFPFPFSLETSQ